MGIRAHVQTTQPEYGHKSLSSWAKEKSVEWLYEHNIDIQGTGDDSADVASHWEIECCGDESKDKLLSLVTKLRSNPDAIEGYAEDLASIIEEGLAVAEEKDYDWICIDWY